VASMLRAMRHRGPDDTALRTHTDRACVGSVRLAIVDPLGAAQPLRNSDGRIAVYFNGEIYNYRQLRTTVAGGRRGRSDGDGEAILQAYEHRPDDFARLLDGMFAFALIDERRQKVVLGRDRIGIKPLYYWLDGDDVWFASELTALLRCPRIPLERDDRAIHEYLTFGFALPPRSFVRGVRQLEPGCLLVVDGDGVGLRRFWSLDEAYGTSTTTEQFGELLRSAVTTTVPDRPFGVFLSGGLDSSAVAASAVGDRRPTCFTVGYDEAGTEDERGWAGVVARHLALPRQETLLRSEEVPAVLESVVRSLGEPIYSAACPSTFVMARLGARSTRVVLSGDGSDELLLGYRHFRTIQDRMSAGVAWREEYRETLAVLDRDQRRLLCGPRLRSFEADLPDSFAALLPPTRSPTEQVRYFEVRYRLPGYHLNRVDRLSMAHSLEVRVPFLRNDVVAGALGMSADGLVRDPVVKRPLAEACRTLLPATVVNRPKQKFSSPVAAWLRGPLLGMVNKHLRDERRLESLGLRPPEVGRLLDTFGREPRRHTRAVWGLLVLCVWHEVVWEELAERRTTPER